ncbi:hypothetical protein Poli38472_013836 [Pythium oligandrum]|uniref:Methyltransferase type 11 domain-containing protein n=1 Tax=Pythium oligandrum TaxID=41045 RepID=A0A8K1C255_PYTOL|nr:hypothetical protein Poli38472_013836 [Pythium oligandrum]|eukprot:TMW55074.1 hypothetical protein Poli38472_013836 [Pythium oligandrum]
MKQASKAAGMIAMYEEHFETILARWVTDAVNAAQTKIQDALQAHDSDSAPFTVLDVGCGLGSMALEFAERFLPATDPSHVRMIASDNWQDMLTRVQERLETPRYARFASQIETKVMDGQTLEPLGDDSVNVVMSSFGISIFPDQDKGWGSAHRVLKPNGLLVATAWDPQSTTIKRNDALAIANHQASPVGGEDPSASPLVLPSTKTSTTPEQLIKRLEGFGFRDVLVFRTAHSAILPRAGALADVMVQNMGSKVDILGEAHYREVLFKVVESGFASIYTSQSSSLDTKRDLNTPGVEENIAYVVLATK